MATLLLSAAGAAIGGSVGGTLAGLSSVAVGRFIGATVGRAVDQKLLGQGSDVVETGKVDRFRVTGSGEGNPIAQIYGRMRVGGQVIWASAFQESSVVTGGGKGTSRGPKTKSYSYSVSLAIALCEGEISRVGRIWADGREIAPKDMNLRVYKGTKSQQPDPKIEAVEGGGTVPAFRGTAYVVMEDLPLVQFGNRVPQFTFEVTRPVQSSAEGAEIEPTYGVNGVALIPGTGEYSLATTPVRFETGPGEGWVANVNSGSGETDLQTSIEMLGDELVNSKSTSLVVSWFGSDLRCGECLIKPKVEDTEFDGVEMPWTVNGLEREDAEEIVQVDDRPVYGGTPADAAVIESIKRLKEEGQDVMFYPFILMEQLADNGLPDPWSDASNQAVLPWRGRITLSEAPGRSGSTDGTSLADAEVLNFFGGAAAADFAVDDGVVTYDGPEEWRYRRFILHYAALCKAAGGVDAFCIGSEMRGLTQIRGAGGQFKAVQELIWLAGDVRSILGAGTKISYASDWSEYFGYQPNDGSGDRYFHLDALWADDEIDFIGIDNYMPLSDWREGDEHADANWKTIYNLDYLKSNIAGGEGYDWYYHSPEAAAAQIRTPIVDGDHGEHWVWRYKDIRGWWENAHYERIGGARQTVETDWVPQSKPIWFTEYGCAAIDKGTNQPNKFLDPKSSESKLPKYSDGRRDDFLQLQYLRAMVDFWKDEANNPSSRKYPGPMVDMSRAHVWSWDARPYPAFPSNAELWSDGANYPRGHWLNGRASSRSLASVVAEICTRAGLKWFDVSELYGIVRGYVVSEVADARGALQPLMMRFGFDAVERDGVLLFSMRDGRDSIDLNPDLMVVSDESAGVIERTRGSDAEIAGRVRVRFVEADGNFEILAEDAVLPDEATHSVSTTELPLALTRAEGCQTAERWLTESRVAKDQVKFALPLSKLNTGVGDVVSLPTDETGGEALYRIDRVELGGEQAIEAVRIEPGSYTPADFADDVRLTKGFKAPVPLFPLFLDLPLISGDEVPHAPHLAITGKPWPGTVAVYTSDKDSGYEQSDLVSRRSIVGHTKTVMSWSASGRVDRANLLKVRLRSGQLESITNTDMLAGGNIAAIGDGASGKWEIIQFEQAVLVAGNTYVLKNLLRGQYGTDAFVPEAWPAGTWFVLLNGRSEQIDLSSAHLGRERHFRIGPARLPYDDPSYRHDVEQFEGVGLRPYAPCHLRGERLDSGDIAASWIRRTRIDGDRWSNFEVPLGEETERYFVSLSHAGEDVREDFVSTPEWTYTSGMQTADGVTGLVEIKVAQVSARFGPGGVASTVL